jgi:DNA-binding winged helix-turn-helix (wHTH) protein
VSAKPTSYQPLRFGPFELDEQTFEIRRNGRAVPVAPRVFDTIRFLIQHANRVVTKEDLLAGPWAGNRVSDAALARAIMLARRALDDDAANPRIIQTVRGRGFRFQLPSSWRGDELRAVEPTPAADDGDFRPGSTPFFGRSSQLASLADYWRAARSGRGSIVLVTGQPGIGKTALLARFTSELDQLDPVFWGRAWESGGAPSFWPWSEVIRAWCEYLGPEAVAALVGDDRVDLTRAFPALGSALPGSADETSVDRTPEARFRVLNSIASFVRAACLRRSSVIVLEDIHAVDDPALALLEFISRSVIDWPLLILATSRVSELSERKALSALVASSVVHRLHLEGLTEHETRAWVTSVHGEDLADPYTIRSLYEVTGGHPFLLQQVIGSTDQLPLARRVEQIKSEPLRVPERLGQYLRESLSRLPPSTCAALEAGAVHGREFHVACLEPEVEPGSSWQILAPAIHAGLIEPSPNGRGYVRFTHDLVRATIYGDLDPSHRIARHAEAAARLSALGESGNITSFELANHLLIAASRCDPAAVIDAALSAAQLANRQVAHELAEDYGMRALSILDASGDEHHRRGEVLLSIAASQHLSGKLDAAERTFRACADWSKARQATTSFARALLGWYEVIGERALLDQDLQHALSEAIAVVDEPKALRAELLAAQAACDFFVAPLDTRRTRMTDAIALARASGDAAAVMSTINSAIMSLTHLETPKETLDLGVEMAAAARKAARPDRLMGAVMLQATCLLQSGDGPGFLATVAEHQRLARRYRYPVEIWHSSALAFIVQLLAGNLLEAESVARSGLAESETKLRVVAPALFGTQLGLLAMEKAKSLAVMDFPTVLEIGREVLSVAPNFHPWTIMTALVELEQGRSLAATEVLERFANAGVTSIPSDGNRLGCLVNLSRIAWQLPDTIVLQHLLDALDPYATLHAASASHYLGPAHYYSGKLRLALNEPASAARDFEAAISDSKRVGSRTWRAWSEYGLALALRATASPNRSQIDRLVLSAKERAATYGMGRLLEEIDGW